MLCKIIKITDKLGADKIHDAEAVSRIGRIIDDVDSVINVGGVGILACVFPNSGKSILTSKIKGITVDGKLTIIETQNSFYYLRDVEEVM